VRASCSCTFASCSLMYNEDAARGRRCLSRPTGYPQSHCCLLRAPHVRALDACVCAMVSVHMPYACVCCRGRRTPLVQVMAPALLALYLCRSMLRNHDWRDLEALGRSGLRRNPLNPKLHLITAQVRHLLAPLWHTVLLLLPYSQTPPLPFHHSLPALPSAQPHTYSCDAHLLDRE